MLHKLIESNKVEISSLCKAHGVAELFVFGSIVEGHFSESESDLDFLVRFHPDLPLERIGAHLLALEEALEVLFHRKVDLLRDRPFVNPVFARSVAESKQLVYAA